ADERSAAGQDAEFAVVQRQRDEVGGHVQKRPFGRHDDTFYFATCHARTPHPLAPSPIEGRGGARKEEDRRQNHSLARRTFRLPLSPLWERGLGGEGKVTVPSPPPPPARCRRRT